MVAVGVAAAVRRLCPAAVEHVAVAVALLLPPLLRPQPRPQHLSLPLQPTAELLPPPPPRPRRQLRLLAPAALAVWLPPTTGRAPQRPSVSARWLPRQAPTAVRRAPRHATRVPTTAKFDLLASCGSSSRATSTRFRECVE